MIARIDGDAERVDLHEQFRPAGGDDHFFLGDVVLIFVEEQHDLAAAGDEHAAAALVSRRRERHADRSAELPFVLPEDLSVILDAVAVGVAQQVDVAVVGERHQRAILAVENVVDVRQLHRQFAHGESRHEHLHRRRRASTSLTRRIPGVVRRRRHGAQGGVLRAR